MHQHTIRPIAWFVYLILAFAWNGAIAENSAGPMEQIHAVTVTTSPLIPKTQNGERNLLVVTLDSGGTSNITVQLASPTWQEPLSKKVEALPKGKHSIEFGVPLLTNDQNVSVRLETSKGAREYGPFSVKPPRKWTVYLTQHTHTDIGYTRPQTEILPEHLRYIDFALDYCDLTDGLPDDARFRWTCETSWAVREYLKGRPAKQVSRLKKRVQEGRIEICGLLLNMSEIATESALTALVYPLRDIKAELGMPVRTAMQNDVNGAGWCLPDYFNGIGIRYLTMGINKTRSLLPFDKPTCFWWESPSGKRILAYRSDHYMTANFWGVERGDFERCKGSVVNYLGSLENLNYPFDRVGVQFSGYSTDNSPPSTGACGLVKNWNEKYAWPKLRLSTAQEFLSWVEKEKSSQLPVHRQAWPDWWTDGFGSAARETAAAREAEAAMDVNNALFAMASLLGSPSSAQARQRVSAIRDNLLFYHEHTYGAAESISDPLAENAQVQWGEKSSYVWSAVKDSALLHEEAFGLVQDYLPRAEVPTLAVINTLNWPRSGLVRVFIDHEVLHPDREFQILDGKEFVLAQEMERRTEGTYWGLWVKDVPALGYKLLRIETADKKRNRPAPKDSTSLENAYYRLVFDAEKGAIRSITDMETGTELVDANAAWGFGQCIYETMPANRDMKPEVFKRFPWRKISVKPGANGPVWRSVYLNGELDGCATNKSIRAEVRLYDTEKRVELHYAVRKLPVPTPESLYVSLPFHSPETRMLYEAQGGFVKPGEDQIPGSSSDWQTIQSFISVRNGPGQIVLGSKEVPLVQLGDFNLGKWMPVTKVAKPHVYSWIMNNYWFTNFRTEQEGEFKWHYYLTSSKNNSTAMATRFGWNSRVPFATRVLQAKKANASTSKQSRTDATAASASYSRSLLSFEGANLLLVEARPSVEGNGLVLHLREVEGKPACIEGAGWQCSRRISRIDEVNALEEPLSPKAKSVRFAPYETKFLKLTLK